MPAPPWQPPALYARELRRALAVGTAAAPASLRAAHHTSWQRAHLHAPAGAHRRAHPAAPPRLPAPLFLPRHRGARNVFRARSRGAGAGVGGRAAGGLAARRLPAGRPWAWLSRATLHSLADCAIRRSHRAPHSPPLLGSTGHSTGTRPLRAYSGAPARTLTAHPHRHNNDTDPRRSACTQPVAGVYVGRGDTPQFPPSVLCVCSTIKASGR